PIWLEAGKTYTEAILTIESQSQTLTSNYETLTQLHSQLPSSVSDSDALTLLNERLDRKVVDQIGYGGALVNLLCARDDFAENLRRALHIATEAEFAQAINILWNVINGNYEVPSLRVVSGEHAELMQKELNITPSVSRNLEFTPSPLAASTGPSVNFASA